MQQGQLWMSKGGIRDGWKDVDCIFREGKQPNIGQPPVDLDDTVKEGSVKRLLHEAKVERHFQREELLEVNVPTVCNVVWGQFSAALREELKGLNEFEERYIKYNVVWLLEQAKLIALGVDANAANAYATVHRMMRSLYTYRQDAKEGCETYSKDLNDLIKTVKLAEGNPLYHPTLHEVEVVKLVKARGGKKYDDATADEIEEGEKISEENFQAILLLKQADPGRFFPLWSKLRTDATLGNDTYPTTWARSYDILNKYNTINGQKKKQPYSQNPPRDGAVSQSGRSFAQSGATRSNVTLVPGIDGRTWEDKTCFGCGKPGHIHPLCPTDSSPRPPGRTGQMHAQLGIGLAQAAVDKTDAPTSALMMNTRKCTSDELLRLHSNGGDIDYDEIGETLFIPMPGYISDANITNVYALVDVANCYRVTMDSQLEHAMFMHLGDGTQMKFRECGDGLYYFDTSRDNLIKDSSEAYSFLNTVAANKQHFHRKEIEGADRAQILQQHLGWTEKQHFIDIVNGNHLINCDITTDDINRAEAIYGPALPILKGKMIRQSQSHIKQHPKIHIPNEIVDTYKLVDLCMDFFFVNGKPYFHTISKKLNFRTTEATTSRGKKTLQRLITAVATIYYRRGFQVVGYHGDNKFQKIEDFIAPAILYICAANQHVPEAERSVHTVKERVRCECAAMPYRRVLRLLMDNIIANSTEWLNAFPTNNGVSKTLSPANIVLGSPKPNCSTMKLQIGSFVQLHIGTTNTTKQRLVGAITLRQNKARGGYHFMSLETGRELHGHIFTELPISDEIIK